MGAPDAARDHGRRWPQKELFSLSAGAETRPRRPVWLTPVMIGISPLSFPSFPVFLMNGPGRTPYRLGPNAARFQLCVLGAGGGFAKALAPLPAVLYNRNSYAAGAEAPAHK